MTIAITPPPFPLVSLPLTSTVRSLTSPPILIHPIKSPAIASPPRQPNVRNLWLECQGITNWDGLLDPLHPTLRSEILRYGNFVEAAYNYNNTLSIPRGYKLTKHLLATSATNLPPRWAHKATNVVGYVAVCDDVEEIKRLGRRDVVVAYRGTATCLEWLQNLRTNLTQLHQQQQKERGSMVACGFLSLYTSACSFSSSPLSLQQMVREEIDRILRTYNDDDDTPLSLTITGHSLGAALATLTAYDVVKAEKWRRPASVTVISFGGPRVGNRRFREEIEGEGIKVLRIVNSEDVITKVPGWFGFGGSDDVAQCGYVDVGKELRLCSRDSPFINNNNGINNVATCHDLKTYLHLIDGFVSSTCPFKATTNYNVL